MTASPVRFPKFMKVAYAPRAPTCIIHAGDDEPHMWTNEHFIQTQCTKFNSDPTINAAQCKLHKRCDKQMDRNNAKKQSDKISKADWRKDLTVPDEYSASDDKCFNTLSKFKSMWDGNVGSIKVVQRQIELQKSCNRPVYLAPYQAGSKAIEFEKQGISRVITMSVIKLVQTK